MFILFAFNVKPVFFFGIVMCQFLILGRWERESPFPPSSCSSGRLGGLDSQFPIVTNYCCLLPLYPSLPTTQLIPGPSPFFYHLPHKCPGDLGEAYCWRWRELLVCIRLYSWRDTGHESVFVRCCSSPRSAKFGTEIFGPLLTFRHLLSCSLLFLFFCPLCFL